MGAIKIKRSLQKERVRAVKRMREIAQVRRQQVTVTIVQDETTKQILAVAVDRDAAEKFRANHGGQGELIDVVLAV